MTSTNGSAFSHRVPIETIEALLRSIRGIRDARVLADDKGRIQAIQVAADEDLTARQVARNVQSALLAQLGLLIDHRIVSVFPLALEHGSAGEPESPGDAHTSSAQSPEGGDQPRVETGHDKLDELPRGTSGGWHATLGERHGTSSEAKHPSDVNATDTAVTHGAARPAGMRGLDDAKIVRLELDRLPTHVLRCRVSLEIDGQPHDGEAEQLDTQHARLEVVARAAVQALQRAARERRIGTVFELDGLERVRIAGHDYLLVAMRIVRGRRLTRIAGAAPIDDAPQDAAVFAVLNAAKATIQSTAPTHELAALS